MLSPTMPHPCLLGLVWTHTQTGYHDGLVWTSPWTSPGLCRPWSQSRALLEIFGLVLVLVPSKTMKRLDGTGLLSSNGCGWVKGGTEGMWWLGHETDRCNGKGMWGATVEACGPNDSSALGVMVAPHGV